LLRCCCGLPFVVVDLDCYYGWIWLLLLLLLLPCHTFTHVTLVGFVRWITLLRYVLTDYLTLHDCTWICWIRPWICTFTDFTARYHTHVRCWIHGCCCCVVSCCCGFCCYGFTCYVYPLVVRLDFARCGWLHLIYLGCTVTPRFAFTVVYVGLFRCVVWLPFRIWITVAYVYPVVDCAFAFYVCYALRLYGCGYALLYVCGLR